METAGGLLAVLELGPARAVVATLVVVGSLPLEMHGIDASLVVTQSGSLQPSRRPRRG